MSKETKDAKLSCVMIVQQLNETNWQNWENKHPIDEANNGNVHPILEETVNRLENNNCRVSEAYGIIHDKDTLTIWNEEKMTSVIKNKTKHIHMLIKFDKGDTLNCLAMATGIEPQYLEKAKSGRYGYDNMTAYLVHAKDPLKFQYSPEEVTTLRGEKYESVYGRRMETWFKGRAIKEARETSQSIDYVVSEIIKGNLSKEQIMLTNDLYQIYVQHKRKINEAFETLGENKSAQTIADLKDGKFKKTIIFIQAKSGVGKTVLAKKIVNAAQKSGQKYSSQRWETCMTAATNPFDEYNGQDILLLDDIRGDSLTVSDWLKILDPYTISPISARYNNKMGAPKVIIITSTKSPSQFFQQSKGNYNEDLGQFFRRIDVLITIDDNQKYSLFHPIDNDKFCSDFHSNNLETDVYSYKFSEQPYSHKGNRGVDKAIAHNDRHNLNIPKNYLSPLKNRKSNKVTSEITKKILLNMKWIESKEEKNQKKKQKKAKRKIERIARHKAHKSKGDELSKKG